MKSNRRVGAAIAGAATAALLATGLVTPAAQAADRTGSDPAARQATARDRGSEAIANHTKIFRVAAQDAFAARGKAIVDPDGATHVRYERTHAGLPVLGGDVVVHLKPSGAFDSSSLTLSRPLDVATTAAVSRDQAVSTAKSVLKGTIDSTSAREVVDATDSTPALAWEVTVNGVRRDQTPSVLHVVVDAATGKVVRSDDEIKTGTGNSMYSGSVTIGTSGTTGNFSMTDPTRGNGNTTDLRGATTGNGTLFTDADNVWGNGATTDRATAGVDAHYGAQLTFDYYKTVHARNG
ncbi:MAG: hypothetical protein QOF58_6660, partial [Pseudonocardiales bacterium]|nr:hypothetical protein [Pseudonocardiales bacterium]